MAATLEGGGDVFHPQGFDPEERAQPKFLVARYRSQKENVHRNERQGIIALSIDMNGSQPPEDGHSGMNVVALVAAFNEALTIGDVVRQVRSHVDHVVVVDDGSTDNTSDRALEAGAEVLRHARNLGKGAAIRTGLDLVLGRPHTHVLFLDGDLQHAPDDAPALIAAAQRGDGDLVLGERPFDFHTMPRSRYYTNCISSWVISVFFIGQRVGDAQSGFRLVASSALRKLHLTGNRYEIETEMLIKLARRGARIARVPITLRYQGAPSKLRPLRDTTRTCFLAVRYRFFPERFQ